MSPEKRPGDDRCVMEDRKFPRTPRTSISKDRLVEILTRRIQEVPNGALRRVFRLSRPDESGCNWVFEIASPASLAAVYEILARARLEFNLIED